MAPSSFVGNRTDRPAEGPVMAVRDTASSPMPSWSKINYEAESYSRELKHLNGKNKISKHIFSCDMEKTSSGERIEIWDISFKAARFEESCFNGSFAFKNTYYVDNQEIVRRSSQYHSNTLGFITIERLDR